MARNRKHRTAALRYAPALRAFLLCVLIGGSGIGYVWQKNQIADLSQQIKTRELKLMELQDNNEKLRLWEPALEPALPQVPGYGSQYAAGRPPSPPNP